MNRAQPSSLPRSSSNVERGASPSAIATAGPMKIAAVDPLGVVRREQQAAVRAAGVADDRGPFRACRVEHRESVGRVLRLRVRLRLGGAVGEAVAARVERQHAVTAREARHLRLPAARVDDRPGRQEQDCAFPVAPSLPVDANALALDESFVVGREGRSAPGSPLRPCLEHEVERRLGRAAEAGEARRS